MDFSDEFRGKKLSENPLFNVTICSFFLLEPPFSIKALFDNRKKGERKEAEGAPKRT